MRKIANILIIGLIVVMIFINYKANVVSHASLLMTQNTFYAVAQNDEQFSLNIEMFLNQKHILTNKKTIAYMYVSDIDNQKKIEANQFEINYLTNKTILGQKYQKYSYNLIFKSLKGDFYIEKAYLTIVLKNDEVKQFKIGKVSALYMFNDEAESHLLVNTLFGTKKEHSFGCLDTVTVLIKPKVNVKILRIKLNYQDIYDINEVITDEKEFVIHVKQSGIIYQKSSVLIEYIYGLQTYTTTMEQFLFFDIISSDAESGGINQIYELNRTN